MILVDTSVWIDHLRSGETMLAGLLDDGEVLSHPFIIGELALGNLRQRESVLADLLPKSGNSSASISRAPPMVSSA